jgi:hypothetical protein
MLNESHAELVKLAGEILDQFDDPTAQDELTTEMQRNGIIDDRGQVVFPVDGHCQDPKANDHSA